MKKYAILFALAAISSTAHAVLLYQNNVQTGFRYQPSSATHLTFDDIQISTSLLGSSTSVDLTRVSVGIRQIGGDAGSDVDIWIGTGNGAGSLSTITKIGTANIGASASSRTVLLSVTSGLPTNYALDMTSFAGKGTMFVGVGFTSTASTIGWRITNGPDANADYFLDVDTTTLTQNAFFFGGSPVATFYAEVEGRPSVVPEPATMTALGLGVLAVARKRMKKA